MDVYLTRNALKFTYGNVGWLREGRGAEVSTGREDGPKPASSKDRQVLRDVIVRCRAKQLSYELAFNLTSYLHREHDYVPWAAFFDVVGFIAGMLSTSDAYGPLQVGIV